MCWFKRFKIKRILKQLKTMQHYRTLNQPTDETLKKEINLYFRLAQIYLSLYKNKQYPFAREQALACYRTAAALENAEAQYVLGKYLLNEARFRDTLQSEELLASESNARLMKQLYEEVHAYLAAAVKFNHIQAKRLLGVCYINGWGCTIDKNKGFDLIIASIEQENSWDRVQKIFVEMGINKPAFFSELFQHRHKMQH